MSKGAQTMARSKTTEISLPPLAHQFVLDAIDKAMREIFDSGSVDLHTWRVANQALLRARQTIVKDKELWTPVP